MLKEGPRALLARGRLEHPGTTHLHPVENQERRNEEFAEPVEVGSILPRDQSIILMSGRLVIFFCTFRSMSSGTETKAQVRFFVT